MISSIKEKRPGSLRIPFRSIGYSLFLSASSNILQTNFMIDIGFSPPIPFTFHATLEIVEMALRTPLFLTPFLSATYCKS